MRIALLSDEYMPNGKRIHAKMLHELALELQKNGHQVIVITPGEPHQDKRLNIDFFEGIEIWRFKSGYTRNVGMFWRLINEFMLSFRAWSAISSKVSQNGFDVCINYSPTIFFGPLAKKLRCKGAFIYLILRDMFPQWAVDNGLLSRFSPLLFFFRYYEKLNYKTSDWIGVQSEMNKIIFCERYPQFKNVSVLMNWGTDVINFDMQASLDIRLKYNLTDKLIFFYGGNIGHAQDMTNIMRLARNLKNHPKAHFLIIGQGDEYNLINELSIEWNLNNVTILPSVPQSEFINFLGAADIGLFSLSKNHTAHNFPGKILGYMSASLPILGSVNPGNDLLPIVNQSDAGSVFVNGEDDMLTNAAINFINNKNTRMTQGKNSHSLLKKFFSTESAEIAIMTKINKGT